MKLIQDAPGAQNTITGYGAGHVSINKEAHPHSLIVLPDQLIAPWATCFERLAPEDFAQLTAIHPEVVLLGTGARLRFPDPAILHGLIDAGIGVEVMDLPAACRTYNILMNEGRLVAAALLVS
jgi:uncharacterized protein